MPKTMHLKEQDYSLASNKCYLYHQKLSTKTNFKILCHCILQTLKQQKHNSNHQKLMFDMFMAATLQINSCNLLKQVSPTAQLV